MHKPRHIAITGASSGIGQALVLVYAAEGITLSLHGRNAERLEAVAQQARRQGAAVHTHTGSVTDADDLAAWLTARDTQTPVDLLIANAGISGGTARAQESAAQVQTIFAVNVTGVFNTVHPLLPRMTDRRRGQIALVSSLAGFRGFAGAPAYCASKAAVRVYGEGLRAEMAPHGVDVNVICPGFIQTPMTDVNPFPMPMLMSAEEAAGVIRQGLSANRARIAFPWPMALLVRLLAALPAGWVDALMNRLPKKEGLTRAKNR